MPAPARKQWAFTTAGHVVEVGKSAPDDAILICQEGDAAWTRLTPAATRPAPGPARRAGLFDRETDAA